MEGLPEELKQKVTKLHRKRGETGARMFLANLEDGRQFMDALNSPVGKQIMEVIADKFEAKMAEIINMKSKSCSDCPLLLAKIELSQMYGLLKMVAGKIDKYQARREDFNNL